MNRLLPRAAMGPTTGPHWSRCDPAELLLGANQSVGHSQRTGGDEFGDAARYGSRGPDPEKTRLSAFASATVCTYEGEMTTFQAWANLRRLP